MTQLTRRQHIVPKFYLKQWADSNGDIHRHDLADDSVKAKNPKSTLIEIYFYEEDPSAPDNRVENILGDAENAAALVFHKIAGLAHKDPSRYAKALKKALTSDELDLLCTFAAYQYVRVPGAIEHKEYELQGSVVPEDVKLRALKPSNFVGEGFAYVGTKFRQMKMMMMVVPDGCELWTSDWPCFDLKDSSDAPLLGEEIGRDPDVVCTMPISPRITVAFHLPQVSAASMLSPRLEVSVQDASFCENQNVLIVQKATRMVVASKAEPTIFDIAAKRIKGRPSKV